VSSHKGRPKVKARLIRNLQLGPPYRSLQLAFTNYHFSLDSVLRVRFSYVISSLTVCTAGVSAVIYILLNWIKPSAGTHSSFREVDMSEGASGRSSPAYDKEDAKTDIYTVQA